MIEHGDATLIAKNVITEIARAIADLRRLGIVVADGCEVEIELPETVQFASARTVIRCVISEVPAHENFPRPNPLPWPQPPRCRRRGWFS